MRTLDFAHRTGMTAGLSRRQNLHWFLTLLGILGLLSAFPALAFGGLKIKPHPTSGNANDVKRIFEHLKRCMGNTPVTLGEDGTITVGDPPQGGDNKFAAAVRAVAGGPDVTVEVGRNVPKTIVGRFNRIKDGADAGKTTGTQFIDLDDLEKIPTTNDCGDTLWGALIHELWEVHYAKSNFAADGKFPKAHEEAIKKQNEIVKEQNPNSAEQDPTCVRDPTILSITTTQDGACKIAVVEAYIGYKRPDGSKAWQVVTFTHTKGTDPNSTKDELQVTKVEIETGAGAGRKRVVVTNPDPSVQYFDGDHHFLFQFENYPGNPNSRPGHLALGPDGNFYISEENLNTVEIREAVHGTPVGRISHPQLNSPRGVRVHHSLNEVYVASFNNDQILVFEPTTGNLIRQIPLPPFARPTDIVLADDGRYATLGAESADLTTLYVCASMFNFVARLTLDGQLQQILQAPDLTNPSGIARDPEGNIYVSSFDMDRVLVFDEAGNVIRRLMHPQLDGPQGIALSLHGGTVESIYVTAKNTQRVIQFKSDNTVQIITHHDTICPKGAALHHSIESPGTREDMTGPLWHDLSGIVTLEDVVNSVQPITFELRPTNGGPPFQSTATLDANGGFALFAFPAQTYDVWVKGAQWLATLTPLDLTGGSVSNFQTFLLAGDANNDNSVDVLDLDLLIQAFDSTPLDSRWNAGADFNCDDSVDVLDLDLLIRNFDTQGAT